MKEGQGQALAFRQFLHRNSDAALHILAFERGQLRCWLGNLRQFFNHFHSPLPAHAVEA